MQLSKLIPVISTCGLLVCQLFVVGQVRAETAPAATSHGKPGMHMMKADTDRDGKISYEEFRAAREKRDQKHFKRMDANGDGFIDEAEKKAAYDKMKAFHEQHKASHTPPVQP